MAKNNIFCYFFQKLLADLRSLQLVYDKKLFDLGWKLISKKWKKSEPEFVDYFEKVYIKANSNWFEGCANRTPKTNNSLETFNRLMKQQQTFYLRKPLNQFIQQSLSIVEERSKAYEMDKAAPTTTVTVADELKLKAWKYSKTAKTTVMERTEDLTHFYVFAGDNMSKITLDDVRKWEQSKFKNFNEFVQKVFSMHKVTFVDVSDWELGKCTCAFYLKNYMCKHILMLAYRLCILDPPDDLIKQVETPAPKKNPRGRPKKATKALIRD